MRSASKCLGSSLTITETQKFWPRDKSDIRKLSETEKTEIYRTNFVLNTCFSIIEIRFQYEIFKKSKITAGFEIEFSWNPLSPSRLLLDRRIH